MKKLILAFVFLFLAVPSLAVHVIYVDADAPGANDGSSWENACNYLQDAPVSYTHLTLPTTPYV